MNHLSFFLSLTEMMKNINMFYVLIGFILSVNFCNQGSLASIVSTGNFNKDFYVTWSPSHVNTSVDGTNRSLVLDKDSGCGFASNEMFLFGQFDMQIKLIPGNSAGTVVAFYLTSDQTNHDEIDFEFLGNVAGQPYTLQTNVYANGTDNREQRTKLWFDPTHDFHTYSVLWNIHEIVFMVDWVPIRTYRNHVGQGVAYPISQPMKLQASIWDGSGWATNGGRDKINWALAPFVASFRSYKIDGCVWNGDPTFCSAESPSNWWNNDRFSTLTWAQRRLYKWARKNYFTYDYCQDNQRFQNKPPKECFLTKY